MPVHPRRQCLDAAQRQPGVERAGHAAGGVLGEREPLGEPGVGDHQGPADHVGVPAQVLGGRVDHHVGSERERLLQVRRRERVVHHEQRACLVRRLGQGTDVGDAQQRVGRRLGPHHRGLPGGELLPHGRQVRNRDHVVGQSPAREHPGEQAVRAAVRVVRHQHVITGRADGPEQAIFRGHAGGEGERPGGALKCGQALLQRRPGRVGRPGVLVTAPQTAHPVLLVGGHLVDRRHHRAGDRVGLLARVDGQGLEAVLVSHDCSLS